MKRKESTDASRERDSKYIKLARQKIKEKETRELTLASFCILYREAITTVAPPPFFFFFLMKRERERERERERDAASDIIPVSHVHSIDQSTTSAPWLLRFGVVHTQTVPYVTISPSNPLFPYPFFFSFLFFFPLI